MKIKSEINKKEGKIMHKQILSKLILTTALMIMPISVMPNYVSAAKISTQEKQLIKYKKQATAVRGNLAVQIIHPKQQKINSPYFNLNLKSDENVSLPIRITNLGQQKMTLNLTPYNAATRKNYTIDYTAADNSSSKIGDGVKLTELISQPVTGITLNKGESKVVNFKLNSKQIKEMVLGSIKIQQRGQKHAIVVAVVLNPVNKTTSEFRISLTKFNVVKEDGKVYYVAQFLNQKDLLNNTDINASLKLKNKKIAVWKKDNVSVAPNSMFTIKLPAKKQTALTSGKYLLQLNLNQNGQTSDYQKIVRLDSTTTAAINKKLNLKSEQKNSIASTGLKIVAGVIVAGIVIYIIWDKIREKKNNKVREDNSISDINIR